MPFAYHPTRRFILSRTVAGVFAAMAAPRVSHAWMTAQQQPNPSNVPKRPDPLALPLVREFVGKAHGDLAATKALLAETPGLLNATWDWGGGDFEMGIGGAGHMGNREIAEFLVGQGGRMDVFVAAMLGKLDIVKAMLGAYPGLLHSKGPHGIPLMAHAKKGGAPAESVVAFLESQGVRS
jgi:hypothetical protein